MTSPFTPDLVLDAVGLFCPEPVMMMHSKIRDIETGQILQVLATDPSTKRDIPKFCLFLGHELLSQTEEGEQYHYLIRKG
ncbi:MAG TPA: sulfurtransferase TusA [Oceanospirillaceae bacterium]|nr:sulfurtransferase TusA [Oceanospirillaceae bacterium]